MTNALANLASQGSKVGTSSNSLQKSLYGVSTSARTASKSSWNLASAIGKFYATYFMVIRGSKKLIEAISQRQITLRRSTIKRLHLARLARNGIKITKSTAMITQQHMQRASKAE